MQYRLFLTFVIISLLACSLSAQNISEVDVKELSDQQVQMIMNEVNARGLTIEQAAQMAKIQGANQDQIDELLKKIQEKSDLQTLPIENAQLKTEPNVQKTIKSGTIKKNKTEPTQKEKQVFGFNFFNSEKLTFEPQINIPTPQNYILGVGDEITIVVWGASQKTYKLKVETSGEIIVPDLGPILVAGIELKKTQDIITKRLTAIYQGIGGQSPSSYSAIFVSNLRSINVHIMGEVRMPGTYTLPATASAFNALYLSGGPNENGTFRSIQVIRDNKIIKTIDVYNYLINGKTDENIQLREEDIINVPVYQKRVSVNGPFKRTGYFEAKETEKLSDIITYAGGFGEKAFQSQLSIRRITENDKKWLDINKSIYDSFLLSNGDSIIASEVINRYENRITITGSVFKPGYYELTDNLTLLGLIIKAQGVKESYYNRGIIMRLQEDLSPMIIPFDVKNVLEGIQNIDLKREDHVFIQEITKMKEKQTLQIFGEVINSGEFEFASNMTLKDLIFKAGGFSEAASESFIEVARRHNVEEAGQILDEMVKLFHFNIDRELKLDEKGDTFKLEPFDYIYVRKSPSYHVQRTVTVNGEIRYPGPYSIGSKKERISDLIKRAGGLTPNAYINGATLKRFVQKNDQNIDVIQSNLGDSLTTKIEKQINNTQVELRLENILKNPGSPFDYQLKDGDEIFIPEFSQEIRITGEIRNPIGLAYQEGRNLKYYIERNGGFGEKAQKRKVFVIYSDGTTKVTRNVIWNIYPPIEPGCQIVIPPKEEKIRIDNTGKWLSIASTMASILLVISNLAK